MRRAFIWFGMAAAAAVAACSDRPDPTAAVAVNIGADSGGDTSSCSLRTSHRAATIVVFPGAATAAVGDSIGFFADVRAADGCPVADPKVRWTLSDPSVARITGVFGQSLLLRTLRTGSTDVIAASQGIRGTAHLTVSDSVPPPPPPPDSNAVASVTVAPVADSVAAGDTATFVATLRDSLGNVITGPPVFWVVADSSIAQIQAVNGQSVIVRALVPGITAVTAFSQGKSGSGSLVVQ